MLEGYGSDRETPTKPARKKQKVKLNNSDFSDFHYNGPWGSSSESDEEEEEPREISLAKSAPFQSTTESYTQSPTESYTEEDFLEAKEPLKSQFPCSVPQSTHSVFGHSKGITKLVFFPKSGHLLLSAGNDGKIFIWDSVSMKKLRGYLAHTHAIRDIAFNSTGSKFISCSFDNSVIVWETSSGEILRKIVLSCATNCAIFNPANEDEIIVGLANNNINHYHLTRPDWKTPIQVYDHHLGPVNCLVSVDNGTKFLSTSDDRSIRVWRWQINIPFKIISDPTQHSMPRMALNKPENIVALQTMDNTIQTMQAFGKFKVTKNTYFKGHKNVGFGIGLQFSHDGSILASGDSTGYVYFWEWKTRRVISRKKMSESIISCIDYHPCLASMTVAGGKSGDIYVMR